MSCLHSPDFIGSADGQVFPVPEGAEGPVPVINESGNQTGSAFVGGSGGTNGQVSDIRLMNPDRYNPNGYIKYENSNHHLKASILTLEKQFLNLTPIIH